MRRFVLFFSVLLVLFSFGCAGEMHPSDRYTDKSLCRVYNPKTNQYKRVRCDRIPRGWVPAE